MKRNKKKDFTTFKKRNTHKRAGKARSREALVGILEGIGIEYEGARISDTYDGGRRQRHSSRPHRDEIVTEGVFSGARGGFGFVTTEEGEVDIFIPEGRTYGAIDGDFVEIIYHKYKNYMGEEKTEGRVTRIVKPGREIIVGTLEYEEIPTRSRVRRRRVVLVPDEGRISIRPMVTDLAMAEVGDRVAARLVRQREGYPEVRIVRSLGKSDSPEASYEAVLVESGIPIDFTPEELMAAEEAAGMPIDYSSREDHRSDIIFTIDGIGAKDLDDAVSVRKTSHGWLLGVHIADVSHYVREKTALDRALTSRGTSVYFTDKVVPMLPPALSNGACSLNPTEDKCALSAFITLDQAGNIDGVRIAPTVISSRVRGVYSEVNAIFDGTADEDVKKKYKPVKTALSRMRELYEILLTHSRGRGMLELEVAEAEILLGEDGAPVDIVRATRGIAERMIEQFMLTANEAVATELRRLEIPLVYRVHEYPPEDKLRAFLTVASNLGLDIRGIDPEKPTPESLEALLTEAKERGTDAPISYLLLRSMAKAKYSDVHGAHFGLGIENYCHFTSPIRRLSDLATHRIIHRVLLEGKRPEAYRSYARRAAAAATECEIRAVGAERKIEDLYKTIYMSDKIGLEYEAVISSVTSFGIFAELDNTVEGLIPTSELPGYFTYDEANICMRNRNTVYRLGDKIRIKVVEADIVKCKLKFALVI